MTPGGNPVGLIQAAQQGPSPVPGGITRPSEAPKEPITAGIDSGRGPGRQTVFPQRNAIADQYAELAYVTGDPWYADLAQRSTGRL